MQKDQIILAGWLIDGSGGPIQEKMLIYTADRLIQKIIKLESMNQLSENFKDYSGFTIIPGLIDAHVHLFMSGTKDQKIRQCQLNAGYEEIKPVISGHLKQFQDYGIIAVRDGGDYGGYTAQYINKFSEQLPVYVKAAGKAWRKPDRYGRLIGRPPDRDQSLDSAILNQRGCDHVKIVNSGLNSLYEFGKQTKPQFQLEELKAGVKAAHEKKLKVMVHCNGKIPVEIAVKAGCDSIEHGFFMGRDNLKLMADSNIFWVPTAITMKAYSEQLPPESLEAEISRKNYEHQVEQIAAAGDLGVNLALGTDSGSLGVFHGKSAAQELQILTKAGYSIQKAVKCGTSNGAALLDIENTGLVKPGKAANFLAVQGKPDELIENLKSRRFKKI
ncbi:Amidohydrolase, family 1 [Desulfonema limicola]|uniref:Amidohydrolase, family 1 n=1 Tax=Desulfonema limicola TaxID=45656 RepID=A0A975BB66_9BACT|nr:amidohydrolase family protein [Desulfonema limicola]QTA82201.1 Amidohydrolase, family 1 [Desulfonema limicola]